MFVGSTLAPATASRSERPEGERVSRRRRRTDTLEKDVDNDEATHRFMRLATYADSSFASPRTRRYAQKAIKDHVPIIPLLPLAASGRMSRAKQPV